MDNSLFLSYLSIKTPVFMDNVPILTDSSMKTPVSMDNPPFLLRLSIKMPLFMDDPVYFLSTRGAILWTWGRHANISASGHPVKQSRHSSGQLLAGELRDVCIFHRETAGEMILPAKFYEA